MNESGKSSTGRYYAAIDLKSFYASCECVDKGLDPLTTNLVVADKSRTSKTICLAVSPSLKSFGIPGRPRLFEVEQAVKKINDERLRHAPGRQFKGSFTDISGCDDPSLKLDYIVAPPHMARYMEVSAKIFSVYLKYVSAEDIFAYSIDEVFIDLTAYLSTYKMTPHEMTMTMVRDVLSTTAITATAGIGTNLYLAKIAMDIVAKHVDADADGVRIAELDEISFRQKLWTHRPLTDFWRIGRKTAAKLEKYGIETMGDIARISLDTGSGSGEQLLYKLFGVNAEYLIDHAWGYEPCRISDVKAYIPENTSLSSGQVLHKPYEHEKARLVVKEMTDLLSLDLVKKGLVTDSISLYIGYDIENLTDPGKKALYKGEITVDYYGRSVPKPAHGSARLDGFTSSSHKIIDAMTELFDRITDPDLLIRRINVVAANTRLEKDIDRINAQPKFEQMDLFTDYARLEREKKKENETSAREKSLQNAILDIKKRYGKNAILKGMNLEEGATTITRNAQVGGHSADGDACGSGDET